MLGKDAILTRPLICRQTNFGINAYLNRYERNKGIRTKTRKYCLSGYRKLNELAGLKVFMCRTINPDNIHTTLGCCSLNPFHSG